MAEQLRQRYEDFGLSFRQAALSLGLNENTANRWMRLARKGMPPYCELMYAVLDAESRRRNLHENLGVADRRVPAGRAKEHPGRKRTELQKATTREPVGAPR